MKSLSLLKGMTNEGRDGERTGSAIDF